MLRAIIEIGSSGGGIDGGQWPMPMPQLLSEGLITKGNREVPMVLLAQLCTHGNGVAIAKKHTGKGIELNLAKSGGADYIKSLASSNKKFKVAYTFPKVNQDFWCTIGWRQMELIRTRMWICWRFRLADCSEHAD